MGEAINVRLDDHFEPVTANGSFIPFIALPRLDNGTNVIHGAVVPIARSEDAALWIAASQCVCEYQCGMYHYMTLVSETDGLSVKIYEMNAWMAALPDTGNAQPVMTLNVNGSIGNTVAYAASLMTERQAPRSELRFDTQYQTFKLLASSLDWVNGRIFLPSIRTIVPVEGEPYRFDTNAMTIHFGSTTGVVHDPISHLPGFTRDIALSFDGAVERTVDVQMINSLKSDLEESQRLIRSLRNGMDEANRMIDHAKQVILRYTRDSGGCDSGKREWLEELGLFSSMEIDDFFSREWEAHVTVTVDIYKTVTVEGASFDDVRERIEDDIADFVDLNQIRDETSIRYITVEPA